MENEQTSLKSEIENSLKETVIEVERLADEFKVKGHLASMELRDTWNEQIEPQLQEFRRLANEQTQSAQREAKKMGLQLKEKFNVLKDSLQN